MKDVGMYQCETVYAIPNTYGLKVATFREYRPGEPDDALRLPLKIEHFGSSFEDFKPGVLIEIRVLDGPILNQGV